MSLYLSGMGPHPTVLLFYTNIPYKSQEGLKTLIHVEMLVTDKLHNITPLGLKSGDSCGISGTGQKWWAS